MISIRGVIEKLVDNTKDFDKPCQVRIVFRDSYGSLDCVKRVLVERVSMDSEICVEGFDIDSAPEKSE